MRGYVATHRRNEHKNYWETHSASQKRHPHTAHLPALSISTDLRRQYHNNPCLFLRDFQLLRGQKHVVSNTD